jgi:hypothetical protein
VRVAAKAPALGQLAVHMDQSLRAGALMKIVDILRD